MKVDEKRTIWTISNGLSAARVVLLLPAAYFITANFSGSQLFAFFTILLGAGTDFLDGYFARKYSQVTVVGKILDPLADKISLGVLAVLLAMKGSLPVWFLLIVLIRDILIFSGGIYIQKKKQIVVQSNWLGKWTAGILALLIGIAVLDMPEMSLVKDWLLYGSLLMIMLSLVVYAKRYIDIISNQYSVNSNQ